MIQVTREVSAGFSFGEAKFLTLDQIEEPSIVLAAEFSRKFQSKTVKPETLVSLGKSCSPRSNGKCPRVAFIEGRLYESLSPTYQS